MPTMGALHDGHFALLRRALAENDRTIVSIFVNPFQFGPDEEYARYPRDTDHDCQLLEEAGLQAVFVPAVAEIYPQGFSASVELHGPLSERLEATARPGHFRGVTTVVSKLIHIVGATRTYFGRKDAQQLLILTKLVHDLAIPTTIVPVPTAREPDGLACSSRNRQLTSEERAAAAAIPRALAAGVRLFVEGQRNAESLRAAVRTLLDAEPRLAPEYVSCASLNTLQELDRIEDAALLSLAARVGTTRLIDNGWLGLAADEPAP